MTRRNKIFACLFLIFTLVFCNMNTVGAVQNRQEVIQVAEEQHLDELIEYLVNEDSFIYSETKLQEWKGIGAYAVLLQRDDISLWKRTFISASLSVYYGDDIRAIDLFRQTIDAFDTTESLKVKARTYYELSKIYINEKMYDESEQAAKQMVQLYDQEDSKDYLIQLFLWRSYDVAHMPNGADRAVEVMEEALAVAQTTDYYEIEAVLYQLARTYRMAERDFESMETSLESMDHAKQKGNVKYEILNTIDIAIDYLEYNNYTDAMRYLTQSLAYEMEDAQLLAQYRTYTLLYMIGIYLEQQEFDLAKETIVACEEQLSQQIEGIRKRDDSIVLGVLKAKTLAGEGKADEAFYLMNKIKQEYEALPFFSYYNYDIDIEIATGNMHYYLGEYTMALTYYLSAKAKTIEVGFPESYDLNQYLKETYVALGDYEQAYDYANRNHDLLSEQLINQEGQYTSYLLEKFQSDHKEAEIDKLSQQNKQIMDMLIMFSFITVSVFAAMIMLSKKNREIRRLNQQLKVMSDTDSLTGLANRRAYNDYLNEKWDYLQQKQVVCCMIDIDYFKKYNDWYGHVIGDYVLRQVAQCLKKQLREDDFLARYGGEEFIVILSDVSYEEAVVCAQNLCDAVQQLAIEHKQSEVSESISLSIGVAYLSPEKNMPIRRVIQVADEALYVAKQKRNSIHSMFVK